MDAEYARSLHDLWLVVSSQGPSAREAYQMLFRKCYAYVRSKNRSLSNAEAEEQVHAAMLKLAEHGVPKTHSAPDGYIRMMLSNSTIDAGRREHTRSSKLDSLTHHIDAGDVADTEQQASQDERDACVSRAHAAFHKSHPTFARALYLYAALDWNYEEIAAETKFSRGTCRNQVHKAKALLRELVEEMCGHFRHSARSFT